jgi:hypothetical protein
VPLKNLENYMHFLRNNILFIFIFLYGCSSSSYKVNLDNDGGVDIIATPDRFLPYCEKVIQDDGTESYGFMIFFLDELKTAGVAAGMLTTKKACLNWKGGAQKILDNGKLITLKGFGDIEEPRVVGKFSYTFNKHGTYHLNGRSMDFFSIRNNRGICFSVNPDRCL